MAEHLTRRLLQDAVAGGYAVPAFNVVDELGMDAVLATSARLASPVVVQMSMRTALFWRPRAARAGFVGRRTEYGATAALHLDHCTDPDLLVECLAAGWESALFDASNLPFEEAVLATASAVADARRFGADIEGEFESIGRVTDTGPRAAQAPEEHCQRFVERTGVAALSPDLGTRHGMYAQPHSVDPHRARRLSHLLEVPLVLHGGSRLDRRCLRGFVRAGVAKVNVSSAVKAVYATVLGGRDTPPHEPLELYTEVHAALSRLCEHHVDLLGSRGRA